MGEAKLTRSMSKKGCSPDNSACEGFFGRLKNEMFYNRKWNHISIESFIAELDSYLHWYNEDRIKISLGGIDVKNVALVGASGSGKSTIAILLLNIMNPKQVESQLMG